MMTQTEEIQVKGGISWEMAKVRFKDCAILGDNLWLRLRSNSATMSLFL